MKNKTKEVCIITSSLAGSQLLCWSLGLYFYKQYKNIIDVTPIIILTSMISFIIGCIFGIIAKKLVNRNRFRCSKNKEDQYIYIDPDPIGSKICLEAVKQSGGELKYTENQSSICLDAIRYINGTLKSTLIEDTEDNKIEFEKELHPSISPDSKMISISDEVSMISIKSNNDIVKNMANQNDAICLEVAKKANEELAKRYGR